MADVLSASLMASLDAALLLPGLDAAHVGRGARLFQRAVVQLVQDVTLQTDEVAISQFPQIERQPVGLEPALEPLQPEAVRVKVYPSGRVWAMIDTLLTAPSVSEAVRISAGRSAGGPALLVDLTSQPPSA